MLLDSNSIYICLNKWKLAKMMKFVKIAFMALMFLMPVKSYSNDTTKIAERPKVGVVLSGGGAKGAAHIGVLKY
jgi:predicted acylesterase/phospholipase RssA